MPTPIGTMDVPCSVCGAGIAVPVLVDEHQHKAVPTLVYEQHTANNAALWLRPDIDGFVANAQQHLREAHDDDTTVHACVPNHFSIGTSNTNQ